MRRLYSAALLVLLPLALLRLWWRGRSNPAYRKHWRERLGFYPAIGARSTHPPVWIHAVSVGEVVAAAPLVKSLRERRPDLALLLTTTTPTGQDASVRQFGRTVTTAYFPFDLPCCVERFLNHFQPRALLIMETELWPNLLAACNQRGISVFLVNGRLSEKSARRYRLGGSLVREMLASLTRIALQSESDTARFVALGAARARIDVTGSLKFDVSIPASVHEEGAALRRQLGADRPVWMAASTRPGEEEVLLEVFTKLTATFPNLLLVLAPRHPERFADVRALCERQALTVCRSEGMAAANRAGIFLLNTMGELLRFYAASDVAFVGGSIAPLGGHNVLEPAGLGLPVVTGPYLYNFQEISQKLVTGGSLKIGHDVHDIALAVAYWLANSDARDQAGRRGEAIVAENRGATGRVIDILLAHGI